MAHRKPIKPIPEPTLRRRSLTYEIRLRVPEEARGGRFTASHTSRSLKTRDKAEAYELLPGVWQSLLQEFADEAMHKASGNGVSQRVTVSTPAVPLTLPVLSVDEICRIHRERIIQSAWCSRREHLQGIHARPAWKQPDPEELARSYEASLDCAMVALRARLTICDLRPEQNFLESLKIDGVGTVADRNEACIALAMADLQACTALRDDFVSTRLQAEPNTVPAPSQATPLALIAVCRPTCKPTSLAKNQAQNGPTVSPPSCGI